MTSRKAPEPWVRIVGPLFAAALYFHSAALPYIICDAISIVAAKLAALRLSTK